ncbi:hypothetical protein [Eudoraea chungangensis]|uniref:hypothetical protein n=1 Tax=Eudoraea chungangensis TaxID=1481905 RepID=UPI0023EBDF57|nr:hypothetical protein [Eudoraea chungangensis]
MKLPCRLFVLFFVTILSLKSFSQKIVESYQPITNDSLRIGMGNDFLPYIQSGFTLMLPEEKSLKGVLIFLEDSGFDQKNKNGKQLYKHASEKGFAVLSVSTEIPFDFYFSDQSSFSTTVQIQKAFSKYDLPNENIFFLGTGLVGHRALKYIESIDKESDSFRLNIKGIVISNLTMDWTRKWYQHKRDIRINHIDLWEARFINYMLETHLKGTPKTAPENYHIFSSYSYFDEKNRNIENYKEYAVRAYIDPAIKYRLKKYLRTLYENNSTDMVGFLAELQLIGNNDTELVVLQSDEDISQKKNTQSTWNSIDKEELMQWILKKS